MGHATACAGALAVQNTLEQENLLANVKQMGEALQSKLIGEFSNHPNIGDIRGRGLFRGIEFVKDKSSKTPFPADLKINAKIKQVAMQNGLMCYPMGGTIDGINGDHILIAPPFIINETQLDEIIEKLRLTFDTVLG